MTLLAPPELFVSSHHHGCWLVQESATALAEMASSVTPEACEDLCVKGIVQLSKDRVWAVRVAAAAAIPPIAAGETPPLLG